MYKIEKNIPVPLSFKGRGPIYPFAQMEVGDSFLVEKGNTSVKASASRYSKEHNCKFSTKKVDDGLRIWRTA